MANPRGLFDPDLVSLAAFDINIDPEGWFDRDLVEVTASAASYSLTITGASVSISGQTVTLKRALRIVVTGAAVSLTGQSVALKLSRLLLITGQSATLAGQSVSIRAGRQLVVTGDQVTLAGQSVTLTYTQVSASYTITVSPASVVVTGSEVALTKIDARQTLNRGGWSPQPIPSKFRKKRDEEKLRERQRLEEIVLHAYRKAVGEIDYDFDALEIESVRPALSEKSVISLARAIKTEFNDEIAVSLAEVRKTIRNIELRIIQAAKEEEDDDEMFLLLAA